MLKYKHIIEQLSDMDKVRILSDVRELSEAKYALLGIPPIKAASFDGYCDRLYPSTAALMNSWDISLMREVAAEVAGRMRDDGVSIAELRGPKPKIDPFGAEISEDPYLASVACSNMAKAVYDSGANVSFGDYGISDSDIKWLDTEVNERFISEYITGPFSACGESAKICALETRRDVSADGYQKINSTLAKMAERVCEGASAVLREVSVQNTVKYLQNGAVFYKGSAIAIESALHRYNNLYNAIQHGTSTEDELDVEVASGRAISPQTLDEAMDRLLELAFSLRIENRPAPTSRDASLELRAAQESIVLLKNTGARLPLKKKDHKVALIGDLIMGEGERWEDYAQILTDVGMTFVGTRRGYDIAKERSDSLAEDAVSLAKNADIAIVFLGLGEQRERFATRSRKISLPANQQHLLRSLEQCASKVIAVVSGDMIPDAVYYDSCAALLYSPINTAQSAQALVNVIMGEFSPSGRLASTVYFDSDELYRQRRELVSGEKIKTGPFFGYRHYDAYRTNVGYEFGYGLSFTRFDYSSLKVDGTTARLTVKNTGSVAGVETVQVYVGLNGSSVIRPKKELMGFARVSLAAGESKTVAIPFDIPYVYDEKRGGAYVEKGSYTVYVGASVTDIRLSDTLTLGGAELESDGELMSDYVQTQTNILSDKYKLEEEFTVMRRKSVFNFIAGGLSLTFAAALKIYCTLSGLEAIFFDLLAIAIGIVGIVFLVIEAVYRNKEYKEDKAKLDELNRELFKEAEEIPVYAADMMFTKEFDISSEETAAVSDVALGDNEDNQYHLYIDSEQSFENAAREFELLAAEKGFKFSAETVRELFSAIAASRLLLVRGLSESEFKDLLMLLGGYFETASHIDIADDRYVNYDNVLFKRDEGGRRVKTGLCLALDSARNTPQSIHFAGLFGVDPEAFNTYFEPFVSFAKNPLGASNISTLNENFTETTYHIPQNLWFVVSIADGKGIDTLSQSVLEVATLSSVSILPCESAPHRDSIRRFSYYQLDYLMEKTVYIDIDEDDWKKIDRLEEYVAAHSQYSIGNKLWLCLERYVAVYLACAGDKADAIDVGVSVKLLPSMLSALSGNMSREEKSFASTLEDILGNMGSDRCKELVKTSGADIV